MNNRLPPSFFRRNVLSVAPDLLGKTIVRNISGKIVKATIVEVEAYGEEEDLACHCSKGRTKRTEIMYSNGGVLYVYLVYGMHWMLNIVTGEENHPQAVLIRAINNCYGPGRLSKYLKLNKDFNGEDISVSNRIWIENHRKIIKYKASTRIGIDYAGELWKNKLWRFHIP